MRVRFVWAAAFVALAGAGVFYVASASGTARIESCRDVYVSGGDFNAATGGEIVAAVKVKNLGRRDCAINARPWVRLGPLPFSVTVADAAPGMYGNAGDPEQTWTLRPDQVVSAGLFVVPGSCDRGVGSEFSLHARAGWAGRSVSIGGGACKNGTGELFVGSFQR
jgi:hypothetical protein